MRIFRLQTTTGVRLAAASDGELRGLPATAPGDYLTLWRAAAADGLTVTEWIERQQDALTPLGLRPEDLRADHLPRLAIPVDPPEVWGASYTYAIARAMGPDPLMPAPDRRPVIFFKATPHRCVGPDEPVGTRGDAQLMIPEAELGVVIGPQATIIGYLACNDVSSRDLPRENPYYMDASKIFARCCALGPAVVPPDAIDPRALAIFCRVYRGGRSIFAGEGTTARLNRSLDELVKWTCDHADVPDGAVLCTGTSISPPRDLSLLAGDVVEVEIEGIGVLRNHVVQGRS